VRQDSYIRQPQTRKTRDKDAIFEEGKHNSIDGRGQLFHPWEEFGYLLGVAILR